MRIGAASTTINGEIGGRLQGATVDKRATGVHEDLEANALYLESGTSRVLLISCDLVAVPTLVCRRVSAALAARCGLPETGTIISATHTHGGPVVLPTKYGKPVDEAYVDRLGGWLVDVGEAAVASAAPGILGWGRGQARIGYNRRCCWADGTHTMHGDASRDDFTGLEGPDDAQQTALFAFDADCRAVRAVLHHNTSHPTCFYGADVYSSDFPGVARRLLRDVLGPIPVLYLNGAFGDISLDSQTTAAPAAGGRDARLMRASHLLAGETLRLLHEAEVGADTVLAHRHADLSVPVRLPSAERLEWARRTLASVDAGESVPTWEELFAFGAVLLQESFGQDSRAPVDALPIHALRVGDVGLMTQPCELYCHFGLQVKRRSPSPITAVCSVAGGYCGYCPTAEGILGGGYSGEPIHWCRLSVDAGYRIVDEASRLLRELW